MKNWVKRFLHQKIDFLLEEITKKCLKVFNIWEKMKNMKARMVRPKMAQIL